MLHLPFNISTIVHFGFTKRERELNNSNQDRNVMHRVDLLLCRMEKSELCPLYTSLFYLKVSHIFWIAKVYGRWCRSSFTKTSVPAEGVLNQSKRLPGGGHTHVKAHSLTHTHIHVKRTHTHQSHRNKYTFQSHSRNEHKCLLSHIYETV